MVIKMQRLTLISFFGALMFHKHLLQLLVSSNLNIFEVKIDFF